MRELRHNNYNDNNDSNNNKNNNSSNNENRTYLTFCNTSIFIFIYSNTTRSSRVDVTEFVFPRTNTHGLASNEKYGGK